MRSILTDVREINRACNLHAYGGSGHPVYCHIKGFNGNMRVFQARTVKGELQIKDTRGDWVHPEKVFTI